MRFLQYLFIWDFLDENLDEERPLADLVKDSINHLTNDLGKDPWAEDFADDVIGDLERNYESFVPEDFSKYQEWASAVASEVSRQVNRDYKLEEDTKEVHDLGNEYDGGYPALRTWVCYINNRELGTVEAANEDDAFSKMMSTWPEYEYNNSDATVIPAEDDIENISMLEELEDADAYSAHLDLCPECGAEHSYDKDTGICINCGFNI